MMDQQWDWKSVEVRVEKTDQQLVPPTESKRVLKLLVSTMESLKG